MCTLCLHQDVYDGQGWAKHVDAEPAFQGEPRCLALALVYDPFQPWKDDCKASASPFLIVNLNAAQPNRFHLGTGCHMAGIADCVTQRAGKRDAYDSVIGIIVDELLDLYHNGISVYDAHAKEHVHIMAKLVAVLSDLQGHRANLKTGCGCAKCTIKGGPKLGDDGKGKTPFHNHAPCLAPGDPLRAVLSQLHNQPPTRGAAKVPRTGRETSTWRYRNQMEMARCTKGSSLGLHPSRHDPDGFKPFPGALEQRQLRGCVAARLSVSSQVGGVQSGRTVRGVD